MTTYGAGGVVTHLSALVDLDERYGLTLNPAMSTSADCSDDINAVVAARYAAGFRGTIHVPDVAIKAANIRFYDGIGFAGLGPTSRYGFTTAGGGAKIITPASVVLGCVGGVRVTAGGTGYVSRPTVSFTGGGGSGATATAYVSGGAVIKIDVTDPGSGYTSDPTVSFTGGGGSGATAAVDRSAPTFYSSGAATYGVGVRDLSIVGNDVAGSAGIFTHNSWGAMFDNVNVFAMERQALWSMGSCLGTRVTNSVLFGAGRTGGTYTYHMGALQLDGSDCKVVNLEVGGNYSGDQTNLWNAAVWMANGGKLTNIQAEGADVGVLITGVGARLVNVGADINYGHGFHLTRVNADAAPPQECDLTGCYANRNSRYATGTFDAFRIEPGKSISRAKLVGCRSDHGSGDAWTHRYGLFDGGGDTMVTAFSDKGAATRWHEMASGGAGIDNTSTKGTVQAASGTSFTVGQYSTFRINNGTPTTITSMTGGSHGQVVTLQVMDDGNTSIASSGTGANQIRNRDGGTQSTVQFGVYTYRNVLGTWWQIA